MEEVPRRVFSENLRFLRGPNVERQIRIAELNSISLTFPIMEFYGILGYGFALLWIELLQKLPH